MDNWGRYGDEPPCEHLRALREYLLSAGLRVWSEHGRTPWGWVNVSCESCCRTYETTLRERDDGTWSDEDSDDTDT